MFTGWNGRPRNHVGCGRIGSCAESRGRRCGGPRDGVCATRRVGRNGNPSIAGIRFLRTIRFPGNDDSEKMMTRIVIRAGRLTTAHREAAPVTGCWRCRRCRHGDHFQVAMNLVKVPLRFH